MGKRIAVPLLAVGLSVAAQAQTMKIEGRVYAGVEAGCCLLDDVYTGTAFGLYGAGHDLCRVTGQVVAWGYPRDSFTNCMQGVPFDVISYDIGPGCGDSSCGASEDSCTCPADCGAPPTTEMNCNDGLDNDCDGLLDGADADCAAPTFVIGGALFADCSSPLESGQAGVTVNVICDGGFADSTTSTGPFGIWQIASVSEGPCIVTVEGFCSVDSACPPDPCSNTVEITVNAAHQAQNQSLAFWDGLDLDRWFVFASCWTGPNVPHASECNVFDTDGDEDVDLTDAAAFQRMFSGP